MRSRLLSVMVMLLVPAAAPAQDSVAVADSTRLGPLRPVRDTRSCVVTHIQDGDTIDCGTVGRIRFIGIDTPELSQWPYGVQATRALQRIIHVGQTVRVEGDVEARDQYGRFLAYVWTDSVMVNWWLAREGWAVQLTYPPNVQYVDQLGAAVRLARAEERGLWKVHGFNCLPRDRRRGRC